MHSIEMAKQIDALLTEYKEMRNEIRAAWSFYYSLYTGIILTGIATAQYIAYDTNTQWLSPFIPFMLLGWFTLMFIVKFNVQHISNYIKCLEVKINTCVGNTIIDYEYNHVKKLWGMEDFKRFQYLIVVAFGAWYLFSIILAVIYLKNSYTCLSLILYLALVLIATAVWLWLFLKIRSRV